MNNNATNYKELFNFIDDLFIKYDLDRNSLLDKKETMRFLRDYYLPKGRALTFSEIRKFMMEVDTNRDGMLSKKEFFNALKNSFVSI